MVLAIATALVKTLSSYLFSAYLKSHYGSVEVDGAPSWYGSEPDDAICVSTYRNGGIEELELTKEDSKIKLRKKVNHIIELVIYKNFKNLTPDEEEFLNKISKDKKLPLFVDSNTKFQNIKVDEDEKKVFVRSCLDKKALIEYEKNRVKELTKNLTYYKSDKAFDELNGKETLDSGHAAKEFDELENSDF